MRRWRRSLALALPVVWLALPSARAAADPIVTPEQLTGYTLTYAVTWNGIPAAAARVELQSDAAAVNDLRHTVAINTWTLPLLDLIWPARGHMEATVAADYSSRHFSIHRRERSKVRIADLTFDPDTNEIHVVRQRANGTIKDVRRPLADVKGPLSWVYNLRIQPNHMGASYDANVAISDDVYHMTVRVVDRGTIRLGGRRRPVFCIQPSGAKVVDGVEEPIKKIRRVRVWITDDALRLPVRLQARSWVGRVTAGLRSTTPPIAEVYAALEAGRPLLAGAAGPSGRPTGE